jgi:E3 ubiquitin-protein ligase HERC3
MPKAPHAVGGDVHSWGSGEMGQLGFPLLEDLPKDQDGYPYEPTAGLIKAFARMRISQIAGGDGHTAAVTVQGKLYSWGASACGQLGQSDTEHMPKDVEGYPYQPVPLLVSTLQDICIVQIACGDAHTVALSREGLLYSWGGGGCGQLGHSETSKMPKDEDGCPYQLTPRVVEALRPHAVLSIACGKAHTISITDKGRMCTWGAGACGQLGHPDTSSFPSDEDGYPFQPVPREVEQLREYKLVATACGDVHTLALTEVGHVFFFWRRLIWPAGRSRRGSHARRCGQLPLHAYSAASLRP